VGRNRFSRQLRGWQALGVLVTLSLGDTWGVVAVSDLHPGYMGSNHSGPNILFTIQSSAHKPAGGVWVLSRYRLNSPGGRQVGAMWCQVLAPQVVCGCGLLRSSNLHPGCMGSRPLGVTAWSHQQATQAVCGTTPLPRSCGVVLR
jgi:hypothetical protein